ncbi:BRO family protein [Paenibacillus larvae]|nr:BRO family protein [Paenibacillus larvae]
MVKERLSDDVSSTPPSTDSLRRLQPTTIINEDGLYDVILESRKSKAREFRKWVTRDDVLPSIRKTRHVCRR